MRRALSVAFACAAFAVLTAARADALTVRDVIELSKAGLGDEVLLALIEVDPSIFAIDAPTLKQLKAAGVTDRVIVAMIKSGRTSRADPAPVAEADPVLPASRTREPEVIVIDHRDAPAPAAAVAPAPIAYPVAVPVYVPVVTDAHRQRDRVETVVQTDQGYVKARVPVPVNCVKAQPVYWGFDGKLRPGSWDPPPTVVCR
jgi:hypothetical protein